MGRVGAQQVTRKGRQACLPESGKGWGLSESGGGAREEQCKGSAAAAT